MSGSSTTIEPMNKNTTPATLLSEDDDRYDFIGLDIVNTATSDTVAFKPFTHDEIDFPGYIESVEKSYVNSEWHTVRVWRTTTRPGTVQQTL